MRYLGTKHQRRSAKLTALIVVIILFLLCVSGMRYMDPPEEYGLAINFGTSAVGQGDTQPLQPIKSNPETTPQTPETAPPKTEQTTPIVTKETVLTTNNNEAIALKKEQETQAQQEALKLAKEKEAKEKQEQDNKKKQLDALIGGVRQSEAVATGGEGTLNRAGDQGRLDGSHYAPSYFGDEGMGRGGMGYGLNGRGKATYKTITQECNESGMVIVKIVVNQQGEVIEAVSGVKGTTNTEPCLLNPAKKIALSHKWPADTKAPKKQIGFVKVNFKIGQ